MNCPPLRLLLPAFFLLSALSLRAATPGATLQRIELEAIQLQRASLDEAVQALRAAVAAADPDAPPVNIVVSPEARANARPVTLELRGVNAATALQMILQLSGTRAETRSNMLWILPTGG